MNLRTKRIAPAARMKAAMKAARIPATLPSTPMSAPPMTGPSAMGMRRTKECTVTPMVRCAFGTAFETMLMTAGSVMAVQEMKKIAPTNTAHHVGTRITSRYPSMATSVKRISARLYPSRSDSHPPGNE